MLVTTACDNDRFNGVLRMVERGRPAAAIAALEIKARRLQAMPLMLLGEDIVTPTTEYIITPIVLLIPIKLWYHHIQHHPATTRRLLTSRGRWIPNLSMVHLRRGKHSRLILLLRLLLLELLLLHPPTCRGCHASYRNGSWWVLLWDVHSPGNIISRISCLSLFFSLVLVAQAIWQILLAIIHIDDYRGHLDGDSGRRKVGMGIWYGLITLISNLADLAEEEALGA